MRPAALGWNSVTGTTTHTGLEALTVARRRSSGDPSFASSTSSTLPRSVHGAVPRFAKKIAPMNASVAIVPAATARSCDVRHFGSVAGSGVGVTVAVGDLVAATLEGVALRSAV